MTHIKLSLVGSTNFCKEERCYTLMTSTLTEHNQVKDPSELGLNSKKSRDLNSSLSYLSAGAGTRLLLVRRAE
jgi:hypothetical protein